MLTGLITHVTGNLQAAIEFYSRALDIVEWGARTWPNLSQEERGVIFEKTFIRGVKKMKVAVMLDVGFINNFQPNFLSLTNLNIL